MNGVYYSNTGPPLFILKLCSFVNIGVECSQLSARGLLEIICAREQQDNQDLYFTYSIILLYFKTRKIAQLYNYQQESIV